MKQQDAIKIFEEKQVQTMWDDDKEEGNQTVTNCQQLKMKAEQFKLCLTTLVKVAKKAL